MFSVRVLAFITAFLLPMFFSGDRLEKTVIAESGVPLSLVFKNECTVPLELYLTAEESQGEVKLLRVQNGGQMAAVLTHQKGLVSRSMKSWITSRMWMGSSC